MPTVVPWKGRRGHASEALRLMLGQARTIGLRRLEITTDKGNTASYGVIEKNGGPLVEEFVEPHYGDAARLRLLIDLDPPAAQSRTIP